MASLLLLRELQGALTPCEEIEYLVILMRECHNQRLLSTRLSSCITRASLVLAVIFPKRF